MATFIRQEQSHYPSQSLWQRLLSINLFNSQMLGYIAVFLILPAALVLGAVVGKMGVIGVPAAVVTIGLFMMLRFGKQLFWVYLIFLITGYLFGGRGFAYVGFFPAYVGEVGLAIGFGCLFLLPFTRNVSISLNWLSVPVFVLLAFILVQIPATIPHFSTYKMDTIRDAMMYIYAFYAILIALLIPRKWIYAFLKRWRLVIMIFIFLVPVIYVFSSGVRFPLKFPGSPVPLIAVKYGDIGVHLAGAATYMLLRLDREHRPYNSHMVWVMWMFWTTGWLLFGASNRAGMLSAVAGVGLALLLWPRSGWYRPLMMGILGMALLVATGAYSFEFEAGKGRSISIEQIVDNFVSIFADNGNEGGLQGTKEWRLNWWTDIWNYTFNGPYFWTGKGYGVNLAIDDGYTVGHNTGALRSPHNSHFNYLARSGVPGFSLWILFLLSFYSHLIWVVYRYRKSHPVHAKYAVWMMVYSVAFLINGSFDLVLESPFAAIWFWTLVGFAFKCFGTHPDAPFAEPALPAKRPLPVPMETEKPQEAEADAPAPAPAPVR